MMLMMTEKSALLLAQLRQQEMMLKIPSIARERGRIIIPPIRKPQKERVLAPAVVSTFSTSGAGPYLRLPLLIPIKHHYISLQKSEQHNLQRCWKGATMKKLSGSWCFP